jgi:hypothetical protein
MRMILMMSDAVVIVLLVSQCGDFGSLRFMSVF